MSLRVSCPYCNSAFGLVTPPTSGQVNCPRCGERFALERADVVDDPDWSNDAMPSGEGSVPLRSGLAQSHWPLAFFAGTIAILVIGFGMWAILRVPTVPGEDLVTAPTGKKVSTFPPMVLPGLRYLPSDTNVVFAVQFRPLAEYAQRNRKDVRNVLLQVGLTEKLIDALPEKGIRLEELDSLVGGLAIVGESLLPRMMLVVQFTDKPSDMSTILRSLKATQFTAPSGATRYKVDLAGLPTELQVVENQVLVFATEASDLDSGLKREAGSTHLPNGVRESLTQLSPASWAWFATNAEDWSSKPVIKVAASLLKQPDLAARLAPFRALAVGASLEPGLGIGIHLRSPDTDGGEKLRDQLAVTLAGKNDQLQFGATGSWATLDWPLGVEADAVSFRALFPAK